MQGLIALQLLFSIACLASLAVVQQFFHVTHSLLTIVAFLISAFVVIGPHVSSLPPPIIIFR